MTDGDAMRIEVELVVAPNGVVTLSPTGDLDIAAGPALRVALEDHTDHDVVLDLRDVPFIDSSVIAIIMGAARRAALSGHRVEVRDPQPGPRKVLELTGVLELLESTDPV